MQPISKYRHPFNEINTDDIYQVGYDNKHIVAKWTGEIRCPLAGEHYITVSDGIIRVFEAYNNMLTACYIAKVYKAHMVECYIIEGEE